MPLRPRAGAPAARGTLVRHGRPCETDHREDVDAVSRAPSHRTTALLRRTGAGVVLLVTGGLAAAGCTFDRDEPATVTMPEMNTTTTTVPGEGPDQVAPSPDDEPLPVAWITQVGGPGDDRLSAVTGAQATVVAVGTTAGLAGAPSVGGTDVLVASIETSGEVGSVTSSGSTADDVANGVTSDDTTTACGSTAGDLGAPPGGAADAWCATIADDGTLGAATQLGGTDSEIATGVGTSPGIGHAYVSGTLSGLLPGAQDPNGRGIGNGDALMMQIDADGRPVWARQFGTGVEDGALAATGNPDGDGAVVGYTDGDLEGRSTGGRDGWISRFDPSGNQRWVTQLGSSGTDSLVAVAATGEARRGTELFVGAGVTDADVDAEGPGLNAGLNDAFVAAVGGNGALEWIAQFGSDFEETVGGVAVDGATVYVTGSTGDAFGDLVDDGGPGGARDGFLAAVDAASGDVLWVSRFGSEGDETMTGLAVTEDGLLVASGVTGGQVGREPSAGGDDGFVIAFSLSAAGGGAASSV
jgi:hypothetical protein